MSCTPKAHCNMIDLYCKFPDCPHGACDAAYMRALVDRALKMMVMAGYGIAPHDSDHNNPAIAWMAEAREALAGGGEERLQGMPHPIVMHWRRGGTDAGGCIAELERELLRLEARVAEMRGVTNPPDGWALVPKQPTEEMLERGYRTSNETGPGVEDVWPAMLAAAPTPPTVAVRGARITGPGLIDGCEVCGNLRCECPR